MPKPKWIKLRYVSAWTHKPETCVLTSAKATGIWKDFNFIIFNKDSKFGAHIAVYICFEEVLESCTIDKDEAKTWVDTIYPFRKEIMDNFNETYYEGRETK